MCKPTGWLSYTPPHRYRVTSNTFRIGGHAQGGISQADPVLETMDPYQYRYWIVTSFGSSHAQG